MRLCVNEARDQPFILITSVIINASSASPVSPPRPHSTVRWLLYPRCNEGFYPARVYYSFLD